MGGFISFRYPIQHAACLPACVSRAAEQLRVAVMLTSTGDTPTFQVVAAAVAAYHWVWVVAMVAASHPELIGQQEREGAALALQLLFETLPEEVAGSFAEIVSSFSEPGEPAREYLPGDEAATLVAIAAAGAAAAGLLELQDWVREGVVPVDLPTDAHNLELMAEVLALVARMVCQEGGLAHGEEQSLPLD